MYTKHLKKTKKGGAGGAILIRILVITLLVVMPLIPTQIVSAQCEIPPCPTETPAPPPPPTSTPYYGPTIVNPFGSTPTPSVAGDCPTGFLEPNREVSMKWLNQCKQCVPEIRSSIPTFAPLPTMDWEDFLHATAAPANTITPNAPPVTPTPQGNQITAKQGLPADHWYDLLKDITMTSTALKVNGGWLKYPDANTYWYYQQGTTNELTFGLSINGTYKIDTRNDAELGTESGMAITFTVGGYGPLATFEVIESDIPELPTGTIFDLGSPDYKQYIAFKRDIGHHVEGTFSLSINVTSPGINRNGQPIFGASINSWGSTLNYDVTSNWMWRTEPFIPVNKGYCSNYGYADNLPGGGEGYGKPLVGLPNINVWQGECIDFIPPFEWFRDSSGSFLFDADLTFPGIGLCPVWVEIEPLEILDITIPFEILIVPALMFIFSLIFKL